MIDNNLRSSSVKPHVVERAESQFAEPSNAAFMGVALADLRAASTIRERWKCRRRVERMLQNNNFHHAVEGYARRHLGAAGKYLEAGL